jgi:hypothetical protein
VAAVGRRRRCWCERRTGRGGRGFIAARVDKTLEGRGGDALDMADGWGHRVGPDSQRVGGWSPALSAGFIAGREISGDGRGAARRGGFAGVGRPGQGGSQSVQGYYWAGEPW